MHYYTISPITLLHLLLTSHGPPWKPLRDPQRSPNHTLRTSHGPPWKSVMDLQRSPNHTLGTSHGCTCTRLLWTSHRNPGGPQTTLWEPAMDPLVNPSWTPCLPACWSYYLDVRLAYSFYFEVVYHVTWHVVTWHSWWRFLSWTWKLNNGPIFCLSVPNQIMPKYESHIQKIEQILSIFLIFLQAWKLEKLVHFLIFIMW